MSLRLAAVSFEANDPSAVGAFWAEVLGREPVHDSEGVLLPGDSSQVGLRFTPATTEIPERNRLHLHLTSATVDDQRRTVDAVLRLGGSRPGSKPLVPGRIAYMNDPEGNEFCVIEPGNSYLAGCGYLGEVTCNGTRATGAFWRDALGWEVVWDEGEQIAIQSPDGGTKIAWDEWPDAKAEGWNRQRFELLASNLPAELERLRSLGATVIDSGRERAVLTDPDGSEFVVRTGSGPS